MEASGALKRVAFVILVNAALPSGLVSMSAQLLPESIWESLLYAVGNRFSNAVVGARVVLLLQDGGRDRCVEDYAFVVAEQ